jgi:glyoxylase-like metal-dependent hydrolase (beta-lactamase superfamily II)
LDSLATMDIPAIGYGIHYEFGLFRQTFVQGRQVEVADAWLANNNPWLIRRPNLRVRVPLYGRVQPIPAARVRVLEDGDTFELGGARLEAHHTAGHAKHHLVIADPATDAVYTGDPFGLVYPALQRAGRLALASTSPTDFDAAEARRSLDRVLSLGAGVACLTHFDAVRDLDVVAAQVRAWIDRSEAWLEAAAASEQGFEAARDTIAAEIRAALSREANAAGLSLTSADWALLAVDIDLNAQGVSFAALKARADYPVALNNLAFALEKQQKGQEASALYRQVLELEAGNATARRRLRLLERRSLNEGTGSDGDKAA